MSSLGRLIVITGGSGTGKSTLARALQDALLPDVWLHFSVDTLLYGLPSSILDRANLHNDWSGIDPALAGRSAQACVATLLRAGHRVVFDCVIMSERGAREMLDAFEEHEPLVVGLSCSLEETRRRTLARGDRTLQEAEAGFRRAGGHLTPDCAFDTTAIAPAAIAARVAERLRQRGEWIAGETDAGRPSTEAAIVSVRDVRTDDDT